MLPPCPASIVNHIRGLMGIPFDSIRREHALKVVPPSEALKTGLTKIGEQLTADWQKRAGATGDAVLADFRK
jgi:hypothetical protein